MTDALKAKQKEQKKDGRLNKKQMQPLLLEQVFVVATEHSLAE